MPSSSIDPGDVIAEAERPAVAVVPEWLSNVAAVGWRVVVIAGLAIVFAYLATVIWTVTASIAVAIIVAAVFAPFVLRLRDQGRTRNAAAGIVWAVAVVAVGGLLLILVLAFLPYVAELLTTLQDGASRLQSDTAGAELPDWVRTIPDDVIESLEQAGGDLVAAIVDEVVSIGTILILATFLLFFFLRDGDKAWAWAFQGMADEKRELISSAGDDALDRVGGYLRGTTVLALIVGVTNYAFMLLLGVPLALPLAVLSFAATYIPYFGGIVATVLVLFVTYGAGGGGETLAMLVLLGIRTFLVSYLVRPMVYRRTVHLHPALVLIVLPAGFQLAGVVGLFAAVPVTAVILTTAQAVTAIIEPSPAPPLPPLVPAWLDRAAQWSWRILVALAVAAGAIYVLTLVPLVLLPAILALILAATLEPLVARLVRSGQSRTRASIVSVGGVMAAIVGVLALSLWAIVDQASQLRSTAVEGAESVDETTDGNLGLVVDAVDEGARVTLDSIVALADALGEVGLILLLGTLLTFYFVRDGAALWTGLMRHAPQGAARELTAAGSRAVSVLGGYMVGTGAISLVGAGSQAVIMWILALPLVMPVFVLSFFGGFIPYIGSALTTLLAFLIALAVGDTIDIVVMFIWTIIFNLVQGNIVAPLVYNRTTHIHPAIVLVSIPAASTVAGIIGMFLVVPVLGVVSSTWRSILAIMGADDPEAEIQPAEAIPPDASSSADEPASEVT
jgi:predicted PurR-regulated permease PerM